MSITNGYATTADLKDVLDPSEGAKFSAVVETNMETGIEAASRWIDAETSTHYYSSTETRYYTPEYTDLLWVDDLLSVTTLKTDDDWDGTYENTWATTDYILEPRNAAANSNDVKPFRQIRQDVNGTLSFPAAVRDGVELIGAFGYSSATPSVIKTVCLLIAHRLYKRHDAIFGIAGNTGIGAGNNVLVVQAQIPRDTDIIVMLQGVDRRVIRA